MLNFGGVQKSLGLRACGTSKRSPWVFRLNFLDRWFFCWATKKPQGKTKSFEKRPGKKFTGFFGKSGVL